MNYFDFLNLDGTEYNFSIMLSQSFYNRWWTECCIANYNNIMMYLQLVNFKKTV